MHRPTHAHTHKKRGSGFMRIRPESASLLLQHAPVPPRPDAQQRCPQGGRARHPAEPCVVLTLQQQQRGFRKLGTMARRRRTQRRRTLDTRARWQQHARARTRTHTQPHALTVTKWTDEEPWWVPKPLVVLTTAPKGEPGVSTTSTRKCRSIPSRPREKEKKRLCAGMQLCKCVRKCVR